MLALSISDSVPFPNRTIDSVQNVPEPQVVDLLWRQRPYPVRLQRSKQFGCMLRFLGRILGAGKA